MAAPTTSSASSRAAALLHEARRTGQRFIDFLNQTGSPYHSVRAVKEILQQNKRHFEELREPCYLQPGSLRSGQGYYITRNNACIAAFIVGDRPASKRQEDLRFLIIGTHADSPCLRLRPNCSIVAERTQQAGVECYGGGLWNTWFDRGLGLAGIVYVKEKGQITGKLVRIAKPLLFIPSLAIHLRTVEEVSAGLKLNKEKDLQPILCTEVYEQLLRLSTASSPPSPRGSCSSKTAARSSGDASGYIKDGSLKARGDSEAASQKKEMGDATARVLDPTTSIDKMMPKPLLELLARELRVEPDAICSWDLCLMDATPGRLCGINEEFVESPRLDNLCSTFAAFDALSACDVPPNTVAVAMAFDHEEVGSASYTGADSCLAKRWLKLIAHGAGIEMFDAMLANSFLLSADMAHAVHPNYADRHQPQHKPLLQQGLVVKENANQRYATNAQGLALVREIANKNAVPLQDFVVRNDSRCGSTVGPFLSSNLGVRTHELKSLCMLSPY